MNTNPKVSIKEVVSKMEYYCAYQERCHAEVQQKLRDFNLSTVEKEEILVTLIQNNYLNEERFALLFAVSKFHQKKWGKLRIKNELKARQISDFLIQKAVKEIDYDDYETTFNRVAEQQWQQIQEPTILKKKKKFCDYLLRKGWETDRILEKANQLEHKMI